MYVKLAVPRPLDSLFDYHYDESKLGEIEVGDWVRVPFGRTQLNACVLEKSDSLQNLPDGVKIKSVLKRLDPAFRIPAEVLKLCRFGSEYYQYSIGEALMVAAPPKIDKPVKARAEKTPPIPLRERKLSGEQVSAVADVQSELGKNPAAAFLLEGVTGSGKTEVYIELAKSVLAQGKSVLILVPEIALTSQLRERFQSGLGEKIALWHSAISDGLRQSQWRQVRSGEIRVVIGARSGIFAPFLDLGLIVVDEEHDQTYKQEERFRYQARDLALFRARQLQIPIVLGSATPSLETLQRVKEKKIHHLKLKKRFSQNALPEIHLVSLLEEAPVGAGTVKTPLAETTIRAMQETLDRNEQIIIFLNRRGFSQFILCQSCGWVKKCDQCSISMTHYHKRNELKCHVCGKRSHLPTECEECHGSEIFGMGSGTESREEDLKLVLNGANILRLDRDQVTSQKRLEETLGDFRELKANILIGTQMLVKGHDFPRVTCVVVVSADMLLKWPDFRASERALQTLTQVSGRAGRAELPGRVFLQGYDLEHPVIKILMGEKSQAEFVDEELALRELLHYPPFSRMVRFRFEHEDEGKCKSFALTAAKELGVLLGPELEARLMGPSEALLFRAQNRYRYDVYFKSPTVELLFKSAQTLKALAQVTDVNLVVDVDPYNS